MGVLVQIPSKPQSITKKQWTAFVLMRKNIDDWETTLNQAKQEYDGLRQEILAKLLDGASIEGGGQIG